MTIADIWRILPEVAAATSYADFKKAIIGLYPGASNDRRYAVADMDRIVREYITSGIRSAADYAAFYREFYPITAFLITENRLAEFERSRAFERVFNESEVWTKINMRLQIKHPDHPPDEPHAFSHLHEAATFVLQGTSLFRTNPATASQTSPATAAPSTSSATSIKTEDLTALIETLAKSIGHALQPQPYPTTGAVASAAYGANPRPPLPNGCLYCGEPNDFIGSCPRVEEDIAAGLVRRNAEGKVVLASGAFPPRSLPGNNIRERVREWHKRFPGQTAKGQLTSNTGAGTMLFEISDEPTPSVHTFSLSSNDRIEALERELLVLRSGKRKVFDGVEITRQPRVQSQPGASNVASTMTPAAAPAAPIAPPVTTTSVEPRGPQPAPATHLQVPAAPLHPYGSARAAGYAPPRDNVFAAAPHAAPRKDGQPAYFTKAPVQDAKIADNVFERYLKAPSVTITPKELLSLSHEVRAKYREMTTPRRIDNPAVEVKVAAISNDPLPFASEAPVIPHPSQLKPGPGVIIVPDPYETYLRTVKPDQLPEVLNVAQESHHLRSILGLVDNKEQIESIIDPGSQIVAMSEEVCLALGLSYDPRIRLNMISANGAVDPSLGIIRNVPFQVGNIVLYLQMHVIRAAAYDILLGRPFDVLTESTVQNYASEDQTITIRCPNTGEVAVIPTNTRGRPRFGKQGFRDSRI